MLLLLPPSEGKTPSGTGKWDPASGRYGTELGPVRQFVLEHFTSAQLRVPTGAKLLSTAVLPAWQRYSGVVWKHLDPQSLDRDALRSAERSVVVVSALGGMFAWNDPVPEYKLKLGATLPGSGRLSRLWRPHLTDLLRSEHLGLDDNPLIIDLLALEQADALAGPDSERREGARQLRVELVGPDGRRSGHNGKAAKGRLARALLSADDPEHLLHHWEDPEGWQVHLHR